MSDLSNPDLDWVSLARGHGVDAVRADCLPDFAAYLMSAIHRPGPFLIAAVL